MQKSAKANEAFHRYGSIFILAVTAVSVIYLFQNLVGFRKDFYNELWGPSHQLVNGKSPYDTADLRPDLPAVWFPMAIGAFFPLGLLSEKNASQIWLIINVIEMCLLIYFGQNNRHKLHNTIILALVCFLSPFTINHINLGQFTITIALCLMATAYFTEKQNTWLAAFCLALALSKPQLGLIAVFGLSIWHFQLNGTAGLLRFGTQTFSMALLMCIPLFIAYPAWIPDWISSFQANFTWSHPSLFSVLRERFGEGGYVAWIIILIIALGITYKLWKNFTPHFAMLWSMGLTTIATSYIWSWDFVLLLPLWMFTYSQARWKQKIFLLAVYSIGWYGMALVQLQKNGLNQLFWWVPVWFIGTTALVANWKANSKKETVKESL